jgi:hypothetical protein
MWAKKIVRSIFHKNKKRDEHTLEYDKELDVNYEETKRRLARVEARLSALALESLVPQRRGEPSDDDPSGHGVVR